MRSWCALGMLVAVAVAGCLQSSAEPDPAPAPAVPPPAVVEGGRIRVDVPVPVYLVGFPNGTAAELAEALPSLRPDANTYNNVRILSLVDGQAGSARPNPMDPRAVYAYHDVPKAREAILTAGDSLVVDGLYDANAVEDLLWREFTDAGITPANGTSGIVLLHLGDAARPYRVHYPTGYIENVRAFGERHPLTALDISAPTDPYVGSANTFNEPVEPDDPAMVGILADAVERATWFRSLQGPLYPQATEPCHAVTLIVAARATTLTVLLPSYSKADDLLDTEYLMAAWESLLGEGRVAVDAKILRLPVDDPVLEALLRDSSNEGIRNYMDAMWGSYHVPHEGCANYLSFFLIGDVADRGVSGIAMYDISGDRRISMSNMNDLTLFAEEDGELGTVFYQHDPTRNATDWVNFLLSHETGHLFGQRHPHDISTDSGPPGGMTFAAIWSAMSYQQDGKIPLFGAIDQNNYARNRAGFLIEAALAGDADAPEVREALHLAGQYRWMEAGDHLLDLVNG